MKFPSLLNKDLYAGTVGAFVALPTLLNSGAIVYHAFGPTYVSVGIASAFGAAIMVALVRGLMGGTPLHLVSPRSGYAAMLASLFAALSVMPSFQDTFADPQTQVFALLTIGFFCTILTGLFQLVIGAAGLGKVVKYVPYPVVAGFINGFAVTLLVSQIPPMLGAHEWSELWDLLQSFTLPMGSAALGLIAFTATLLAPRFERKVPAALWGLLLGTSLYQIAIILIPGVNWGSTIGFLPHELPVAPSHERLMDLLETGSFSKWMPVILGSAVVMALVASIQSLISITTVDAALGTRHNSDHELVRQGAGNILSGFFGGMPTGGSTTVNTPVIEAGGRGRLTNFSHAMVLAALIGGLGFLIGAIPFSVMAGVVVATTFSQLDEWTRNLLRSAASQKITHLSGEVAGNLGLVAAVTTVEVLFGVLPALVVGIVLAFSVFVRQSTQSVVRRTIPGNVIHSRTSRAVTDRILLDGLSHQLVVVEVQGAIFFGSADQLTRHMEEVSAGRTILILDLKRTTDIDSSGVIALERLDKRLSLSKCTLFLAHVEKDGAIIRSLREMGMRRIIQENRVYEDRDAALSAAEDALLEAAGAQSQTNHELTLEEFDILLGLDQAKVNELRAQLIRREYAAGERIVAEGDSGDSLLLLAHGRVTVTREVAGRQIRFANYSPGICFGEIGMLTGRLRGADVYAATPTVCWEMSGATFRKLRASDPMTAQLILQNLCVGLSNLVTSLSNMVRELEQ